MTTLLVSRHGDADYPVHGLISDEGGWLTDKGRGQVQSLADSLAGQGVSSVYSSTMERAIQSAEVASQVLGIPHTVVDGLQEYAVGGFAGRRWGDPEAQAVFDAWLEGDLDAHCPDAEDGHAIVTRYRAGLQEVVDATGDAVALVFSHGGVMSLCLPRLSTNVRDDLARRSYLPNAVPARVEVTDTRFEVVAWPGVGDKSVI